MEPINDLEAQVAYCENDVDVETSDTWCVDDDSSLAPITTSEAARALAIPRAAFLPLAASHGLRPVASWLERPGEKLQVLRWDFDDICAIAWTDRTLVVRAMSEISAAEAKLDELRDGFASDELHRRDWADWAFETAKVRRKRGEPDPQPEPPTAYERLVDDDVI